MAENDNPNNAVEQSPAKNTLAALVALVFVLTTGYLAFNYFNKTILNVNETPQEKMEKKMDNGKSDVAQNQDQNQEGEILTGSNTVRAQEGSNGENGQPVVAGAQDSTLQNSEAPTWRANDYNNGDITRGQYEVQQGDTLWEIAEAVYGNGADWVNILQANADDIGTLSNGQQALITPGQVLTLP